MRIPIAAALYHPQRVELPWQRLDLATLGSLEFFPPDHARFPALELAYAAFARGGTAPAILNAANEVAVQAFLDRRLRFTAITEVVADVLARGTVDSGLADIDMIMAADTAAREAAAESVRGMQVPRRG
jgi:1-deoxy-D-xylulose-5-phosphate reductoisomerase